LNLTKLKFEIIFPLFDVFFLFFFFFFDDYSQERWPDGNFPCPKDVKYTDLNDLAHAAAVKIMQTKNVENPTVLKGKIKKQINRALTNKRRHLAIKSNPEMREKVVNKMKRFRAKTKDSDKRSEHKSSADEGGRMHHPNIMSLGSNSSGATWPQSSSGHIGSSHSMLQMSAAHLAVGIPTPSLSAHNPSYPLSIPIPFAANHSALTHTLSH
jgi:hypothetical protein